MEVRPNEKPLPWYKFRWWLAYSIMKLVRWVYPTHPEVTAFTVQCISDQMIYGQIVIRINPKEVKYEHPETHTNKPNTPKS